MSRYESLWVISYDITENKRRRRVAHQLEGMMTRVQFSVFEGRLSVRQVGKLVGSIEKELSNGDSLRVYSISTVGERRCEVRGDSAPIDRSAGYWLL